MVISKYIIKMLIVLFFDIIKLYQDLGNLENLSMMFNI